MQKIIEPTKEAIIEHHCDGCQRLIIVSGISVEAQPETGLQVCVALQCSFGYNNKRASNEMMGLVFNHIYCDECSKRLVKLIEKEFKITIETEIFKDE